MFTKKDKNQVRQHRHVRVRGKVSGTAERPRLNVYRSLNEIYVQIIDDTIGHTLVACSSLDKALAPQLEGLSKIEKAKAVGAEAAKRALAKNIENVVFDRGGYRYIGRVQALADGAREAGLKF